ncbi:hypothetical protein [Sphingobium lactosutens]|uniref:Uncharacterized protein n=1 Tax=Sphingobium lactosutens DS20 TaxID=1331060 RepID=T0J1B6_9SPHN|nr:hypothetical protein [Sphingobium lactosutens]EQB15739.1 hypothetical protein RLDS_10715 [Sphingobium lactosutens DS20]
MIGPALSEQVVQRLKEATVVGLEPELREVAQDDNIPPDQMIWSLLQMHLEGAVAVVASAPQNMRFDMSTAVAAFLGYEMGRLI